MLATVRDTVFVAANLYPIVGDTVRERPFYIGRIPGGPLPAPTGDFQFVYPKVVATPDGDVHLMWAEFETRTKRVEHWAGAKQTTLWHSVLRNGLWSTPEVVYRSNALQWTKDDGHLAVNASGVLHAVVWAFGDSTAGVVHLRRDPSGWRARPVPHAETLLPAAAIAVQGDAVTIAFAAQSFTASDTTGVTIVRSTDGGKTWAKPLVLRRLGGRGASHPQFGRNNGRLWLAWAESPPRSLSIDTLRISPVDSSAAADGVVAIALPKAAAWFSLAVAPCGELSVLAGTLSLEPRTFEIIVSTRGQAAQRSPVAEDQLATFAGVAAKSREFLTVLAVRPAPGNPARVAIMSRPSCVAER